MVGDYLFFWAVILIGINATFLVFPKPVRWTWAETYAEINGFSISVILIANLPLVLMFLVEPFKLYFAIVMFGYVSGVFGLTKLLTEGGFRQFV